MNFLSRRSAITLFAVGLLTAGCSEAYADGHAGVEVAITNFTFEPAQLVIPAGTKVTFVNQDGAPHTATANNGSFDTGTLSRGQEAALTFTTPGTYEYFCAVHPHMTATIVVQ